MTKGEKKSLALFLGIFLVIMAIALGTQHAFGQRRVAGDIIQDKFLRVQTVHWEKYGRDTYRDTVLADSGRVDTSEWMPIEPGGGEYAAHIYANEGALFQMQCREHASVSAQDPDLVFALSADSLTIESQSPENDCQGTGHIFKVFPRDLLHDVTVSVRWLKTDATNTKTRATLAVYDGVYHRWNNAQFPSAAPILAQGAGELCSTHKVGYFAWTTTDLDVDVSDAEKDQVTLFCSFKDSSADYGATLKVAWLRILDSAGSTVQELDIAGDYTAEVTGDPDTTDVGIWGVDKPEIKFEYQLGYRVDSNVSYPTNPQSDTYYEPMSFGVDHSLFADGSRMWTTIGTITGDDGRVNLFPLELDGEAEGIRFRVTRISAVKSDTPAVVWMRLLRRPK